MTKDRFIKTRDSFLNTITSVNFDMVLNDSTINPQKFSGRDIAAEIKMAMD